MKVILKIFFILLIFVCIIGVFSVRYYKNRDEKDTENNDNELFIEGSIYKEFNFESDESVDGWRNKVFKGKTKYWLDKSENKRGFLHSKSENSSSAFYKLLSFDPEKYPLLKWSWRPVKFPDKTGIKSKKQKDDYVLRVYVVFASGFFTNFRCIEYLWAENLEKGKVMASPYSEKIKQIVLESGDKDSKWKTETRNIVDDYRLLFGEEPRLNARAIAVMSDSEGCSTWSEGYFDDIKVLCAGKPDNEKEKQIDFSGKDD